MRKFDAVDLGIIWSRLVSIADEMVSALVRTSFSTMVRESGDYSCMLFDARGQFLSQGTASVPSFTGTGPATLRGMLAVIPPDTLEDGDVLLTNDPWIGTGHVYDVNIVKPIFHRGELVGYALSVSHLADIGGIGYGTGGRDVYEEGICIPPVKLFQHGAPNKFVFALIEANVRFRELVVGDIYSNIAACNVGYQSFSDLLAEYDIEDFAPAADGIFALARDAIAKSLDKVPSGVFRGSLPVEGIDDEMVLTLAVSVAISSTGFVFDFAGTSPVVSRGINVPLCYTRAYSYFCFKTIVAPNIPNNQAILDFVSVAAPENCILNAQRPWPTGGRHILGHYVAPLVFGALAEAAPARVQADSGMICQVNFRGRSPAGRSLLLYPVHGGRLWRFRRPRRPPGAAWPLQHDRHPDRDLGGEHRRQLPAQGDPAGQRRSGRAPRRRRAVHRAAQRHRTTGRRDLLRLAHQPSFARIQGRPRRRDPHALR